MKVLAVVALAALGVVLAQTPPTISPSFGASVTGQFGNRSHIGSEYVDAQNQRTAFLHLNSDGSTDGAVTFSGNHSAYHYGTYNGSQHCQEEHDPRPFFNQWDWVAHSKSSGSCTVGSTSGQQWTVTGNEGKAVLCANGNIPLQVVFTGTNGQSESTTYNSFTAGVPTPDKFSVPAHCWHHH